MKTIMKYIAMLILCFCCNIFSAPLADGAPKFLGNITTNGQVRNDFSTYWNQITAENECKWASIEGNRGNYNFSGCDACYNWAKKNNGHFKFHALVWGSQYPNWLNGLSADETKKAITAWFDKVAEHYPDLEMIDVVNEAIKPNGGNYHSGYGNGNNIIAALGGDNGNYEFVTTAFKMARERWPKAILIYNDYNTVQWNKNEGIDLINKIKKAGAPVDAYGLQAHDMTTQGGGAGGTGGGGSCLNINTLKSTIEEIWNKTQMPMFISEYDIGIDDDNTQKKCYEEQISYFMENEHIAGITLWGYIYGATWINGGNSGIIKNGQDRAAMTWLKQYFGDANNKSKFKNTTGLINAQTAPIAVSSSSIPVSSSSIVPASSNSFPVWNVTSSSTINPVQVSSSSISWFTSSSSPIMDLNYNDYDFTELQQYRIFDQNGAYMGTLSAYGFKAAEDILNTSSKITSTCICLVKNKKTNETRLIKVIK